MTLPTHSISSQRFMALWLDQNGKPLACEEKEKTLNENINEILALCQDALEDAVLMGCDEQSVRQVFYRMIDSLQKPF